MIHGCDGFFKVMLDDFADTLVFSTSSLSLCSQPSPPTLHCIFSTSITNSSLSSSSSLQPIPPRFVRTVIRQQQWDAVKLRSSLGQTWTVGLQDDADGYRCFRSGWRDFVQGHDIRFGYILLFDYSGNMGFFVRVYDHSACVIRYAPSITNRNHVVVEDDDDAGPEEDCKIQEKPKVCKQEVIYLDRTEDENVIHQQSQTEDKPQLHSSGKPKFRVKMRARDLLRETSMHIIPTSFLESNNLTSIRKATLSNSAGIWTVNVHHRSQNKRKCNNVFGHGWLTYFKDNKLKAGDVCIFELVSVRKNEAHFFVTTEQDLICTSSKSKEEADQEIDFFLGQSASSRCPRIKRPYFTVVINKCHLSRSNNYLHIPASFNAWDYLSSQPSVTVMDTDGKSWKMAVCLNCSNNRKYVRLGVGWLKFCHDKKVDVGDVCTFELTSNGKKAKLIVNIQKKQFTPSFNVKNKETSVDIIGDKSKDGIIDVENCEQQNGHIELTSNGKKAKMIVNNHNKQFTQSFNVKNKETSVDIAGDKRMDGIIDVETWEQQNDVRSKKRNEKQPSCRRYPKRQKVAHAKSSSIEHIQSELSEKPHFLVTLKSYNIHHGSRSQLNVPKDFNGWKFLSGNCKVKLLNARGKSWVVSICLNRERIRFGSGWYLFACDNGLKEGDLCRFTLISMKEAVMRLDVLTKETNLNT